jgi:tetratricopeptide (TPR) repeat protein
MTLPSSPSSVSASVVEIERRIQWPAISALLFVGMMVALGVVAFIGIRREPAVITGLPDDPDARAAALLVQDGIVLGGELRLFTSLRSARDTTTAAPPAPPDIVPALAATAPSSMEQAAALLYRAQDRNPREPRLLAALGALELAQGALPRAERHYRDALRHAPEYGEARLGLGVARALIGEQAGDERVQRRLELQALAHLAAVRPPDPAFETALWDRVLLLERVGRDVEARRCAGEYCERYPTSPWADRMSTANEAERRR